LPLLFLAVSNYTYAEPNRWEGKSSLANPGFSRPKPSLVEDEILVRLKPKAYAGTLPQAKTQILQLGGVVASQIERQEAEVLEVSGEWIRVRTRRRAEIRAFLVAHPEVAEVAYNYRVYADALSTTYTPVSLINDPLYADGSSQWWLNRTYADMAKAHGFYFGSSADVIVAVADTGVDADHPELAGRLVAGRNTAAIPDNNNTDDDNIYFGGPSGPAIQGHGTHVAGIIIAEMNNASDTAGAAWQSQVKIMPLKVLDPYASGFASDIAAGISWAISHGADIINLSLSGTTSNPLMQAACQSAYDQGVLLIASTGNENVNLRINPTYPACYDTVLAVGATDAADYVTSYSNYSDPAGLVDCVAPGGALFQYAVGFPADGGVTSTARTGGVSAVDGTSFAAPQVAALAGLLKAQDAARNGNALWQLIIASCNPKNGEDSRAHGAGRINFYSALDLYFTPTATPSITPSPTMTPTSTITRTATPWLLSRHEVKLFSDPRRREVAILLTGSGLARIRIWIFNASGERVLEAEENSTLGAAVLPLWLDGRHLRTGIYFVRVEVKDQNGMRVWRKKLAHTNR
jgi:subtilisin family serine protease